MGAVFCVVLHQVLKSWAGRVILRRISDVAECVSLHSAASSILGSVGLSAPLQIMVLQNYCVQSLLRLDFAPLQFLESFTRGN